MEIDTFNTKQYIRVGYKNYHYQYFTVLTALTGLVTRNMRKTHLCMEFAI
jgi:hypothetical protein